MKKTNVFISNFAEYKGNNCELVGCKNFTNSPENEVTINMVKNSYEQNDKNGQSIQNWNCPLLKGDKTSSSSSSSSSSSNSSSIDETATLTVKPRRYITLPCGKRKWVRTVPQKKRGKDKKPRKNGEEHGNWKHGFGKSRPYDTKKYAA